MSNLEQISPEFQNELKTITEDGKILQQELVDLKAKFHDEVSQEIKDVAYEYFEQQVIQTLMNIIHEENKGFSSDKEVHRSRVTGGIQIDNGWINDTDLLSGEALEGIAGIYNKVFKSEISTKDFGTRLAQRIQKNRNWTQRDIQKIGTFAIDEYTKNPSPQTSDALVFTFGLTQDEGLGTYIRKLNFLEKTGVDLESKFSLLGIEFYNAKNLLGEEIYVFKNESGDFAPAFAGKMRQNIDFTQTFKYSPGNTVGALIDGTIRSHTTGGYIFNPHIDINNPDPLTQDSTGYIFSEHIEGGKKKILKIVSDGNESFITDINAKTYFRGMGLSEIGGDISNIASRLYNIDDKDEFINARKGEYAVLVNYNGEILFEDLKLDSLSDAKLQIKHIDYC